MMPGIDSLSGDTTLLLREILQNKENKMSNNNNNNNNNSIKSFCPNGNMPDSDMIEGMLRSKPGARDTHSVDTASVHSCCNGSVADSDVDSARGDGDVEDVVDDEKVYDDMVTNDLEDSPVGDTKEAKRARVENIITSMRPSSGDHPDNASVNSSDMRRPKRKQLQPQQHDTKFGCSETKYHRGNHNVLHEHILQLQHQLQVVKQRCDALCGDDVTGDVNKQVSKYSDAVRMWMKEKEMENKECNGVAFESRPDELVIPKPGDFNAFKAATSKALVEPDDLQQMAESVKTEIVQSITKAVDSAVNKLIEKCVLKSAAFHQSSSGVAKKCREAEKKQESIWNEVKSSPVIPIKHDLIHDHIVSRAQDKISAFEPLHRDFEMPRSHVAPHVPFPHFPYYFPTQMLPPMYATEPEQTEALPLVVSNTPKKKRTKVTDTRLSPRAKTALLQDNSQSMQLDLGHHTPTSTFPHFLPHMLPTSVAIPNPSLQHSDVLGFSMRERCLSESRLSASSPPMFDRSSPKSPDDGMNFSRSDMFEGSPSDSGDSQYLHMTSTLTPMHLRKAKLMFFYVRYPSSAILKIYFPDVKFNKNNTAQLVKWFSNFREFYYIQMEKYARQSIAEGCKYVDDLVVTTDSELYRVLNLHYNRNNQLEVPESFRLVIQATLREFFRAVITNKDTEPSWKKSIYKVISRMDDTLPEYFKSPNWLEQLGDV
ncbi:prospero homeobox protein 1-like isoform X2 [Gigantopelta aegis]|nr:prospero homeobox protein 1-like isoform X2 [Gigantopelta aegis]